MTTDDLKELVAAKLDVHELLDIIGYSMWELVEALEEEIEDYAVELERACG